MPVFVVTSDFREFLTILTGSTTTTEYIIIIIMQTEEIFMKFRCETAVFSQACQNVQRAASAKTSIPAVEGILIKALGNELILTGYDLEIGINTSVKANVEEQGAIILNAKVLCEILRRIPNETISVEADDRNLAVIRSGDIKYEIMGISADEYPELPSVKGGFPIIIKGLCFGNLYFRKSLFITL